MLFWDLLDVKYRCTEFSVVTDCQFSLSLSAVLTLLGSCSVSSDFLEKHKGQNCCSHEWFCELKVCVLVMGDSSPTGIWLIFMKTNRFQLCLTFLLLFSPFLIHYFVFIIIYSFLLFWEVGPKTGIHYMAFFSLQSEGVVSCQKSEPVCWS